MFERGSTLLDTELEFVMRSPERVLLLSERPLGRDALGDVDCVAEYVRGASRLFKQHIAVHPHALAAVAGDDAHQTGILPVGPNALQVIAEPRAGVRREKVGEVLTHALLDLIAKRTRGRGVDGLQTTV